jgi:hypothetical protein
MNERTRPDTQTESQQAPDASSDRATDKDANREGRQDRDKRAPLEIKEIENMEDDAKGG